MGGEGCYTMISLGKLLAGITDCKTDAERVTFLQNIGPRYQEALRIILRHALDPKIKFLLPEGAPPYSAVESTAGALIHGVKKLRPFIEGGYPTLKQMKREVLFEEFLTSLLPEDAELVVAMKDKKLPYPELNKKVVLKAFPGLF